MRYDNNLRYAVKMLAAYKGTQPLSIWLKEYFRNNKQMGSSDRRIISEMMYGYFRLGKSLQHIPAEQKILTALFLINEESHPVLLQLRPEWNKKIADSLASKLTLLKHEHGMEISGKIFPYTDELSDGVDAKLYEQSFLIQPKLFIRIRPGKHSAVLQKLNTAKINYEELSADTLSFSNRTKLDILNLDDEAVVQDFNSQRTTEILTSSFHPTSGQKVWDCCAASGGKSILLSDKFPNLQLTVSDKRKLILDTLSLRLKKAGITNYTSFVLDLSNHNMKLPADFQDPFDLLVIDAPCTGAGTWSRTPEQLFYFNPQAIEKYALLQKQVVENVVPYLSPGGLILYITCSVFRKENEEMTQYIKGYLKYKEIHSDILAGYEIRADSMYVALFAKPKL